MWGVAGSRGGGVEGECRGERREDEEVEWCVFSRAVFCSSSDTVQCVANPC